MAFLSNRTAVSVKEQVAPGTWASPTSADYYPMISARIALDPITAENPEYLGTIHKPGDIVLGSRCTITLTMAIRPPGGASVPTAGSFIPGRFLKAAGFTESVVSAAIPVAPAALGSGSTTSTAVLGAAAAATANLYKGMGLILSDNGTGYRRQLTAIRSYTAGKAAGLFEVLGAAPAANYQIPPQLAYHLSASATPPSLSMQIWQDQVRYDVVDLAMSSFRFNFVTSTRDATDYSTIEMTLDGDLYDFVDDAAPAITPLGGIPAFKDGDFWLAAKANGGASFSVDMGLEVGYAPDPNRASGNEPAQLTGTKRTASLTLNHKTKAYQDLIALANAQTQHGLWAQYGYVPGEMVLFNIPNGRLSFPNPDNGGQNITQSVDLLIDDAERAINLVFPYAA